MQYAVGDDSDVGTLLDQGNIKEATQLASAVLSVLSTDSDNALKQQEKIKVGKSTNTNANPVLKTQKKKFGFNFLFPCSSLT